MDSTWTWWILGYLPSASCYHPYEERWGLAKAIVRGDLDDLGMCHNCYANIPSEADQPESCPKCGHFDINDWEYIDANQEVDEVTN